MNIRSQEHEKAPQMTRPLASPAGLVQRKCACGGAAGFANACSSCRSTELATPRSDSLRLSDSHIENNGSSDAPKEDFGREVAQSSAARGHDFGRLQMVPPKSAGKMSMHVSSISSPLRNSVTEVSDEDLDVQTSCSAATSGNRIDFTFDPTTSSPRPQCDRIIMTQWIQMLADGAAIMPGTFYSPFVCRDPTCLSDATYLDHGRCTYTTPYPVDRGIGTAGSSNGTVTNATHYDVPNAGGGGDRGFKTAANPTGWDNVTWLFGTYAFCAAGTDCGTWYDGIEWNYTKTAADAAAGRAGVATATASALPPGPGATIIAAFDQYNSVKGFTPCMYSTAGP